MTYIVKFVFYDTKVKFLSKQSINNRQCIPCQMCLSSNCFNAFCYPVSMLKNFIKLIELFFINMIYRAFAPLKKPPKNVTKWDKKLLFLKDELQTHSKQIIH